MSPNSNMTAVLMSARWCGDRHREKEHVKMRMGEMHLQARGPPEAGREARNTSSQEPAEGPWCCHTLISDFCLSEM